MDVNSSIWDNEVTASKKRCAMKKKVDHGEAARLKPEPHHVIHYMINYPVRAAL